MPDLNPAIHVQEGFAAALTSNAEELQGLASCCCCAFSFCCPFAENCAGVATWQMSTAPAEIRGVEACLCAAICAGWLLQVAQDSGQRETSAMYQSASLECRLCISAVQPVCIEFAICLSVQIVQQVHSVPLQPQRVLNHCANQRLLGELCMNCIVPFWPN